MKRNFNHEDLYTDEEQYNDLWLRAANTDYHTKQSDNSTLLPVHIYTKRYLRATWVQRYHFRQSCLEPRQLLQHSLWWWNRLPRQPSTRSNNEPEETTSREEGEVSSEETEDEEQLLPGFRRPLSQQEFLQRPHESFWETHN